MAKLENALDLGSSTFGFEGSNPSSSTRRSMSKLFKCLRCGMCCKDVPLFKHEYDMFKHILDLELGKGWEKYRIQKNSRQTTYWLKGQCPFVEYDENGMARCRIYSFRPTACKVFPKNGICLNENNRNETQED